MIERGVVDDAMAQQRPILHQPEHCISLFKATSLDRVRLRLPKVRLIRRECKCPGAPLLPSSESGNLAKCQHGKAAVRLPCIVLSHFQVPVASRETVRNDAIYRCNSWLK